MRQLIHGPGIETELCCGAESVARELLENLGIIFGSQLGSTGGLSLNGCNASPYSGCDYNKASPVIHFPEQYLCQLPHK